MMISSSNFLQILLKVQITDACFSFLRATFVFLVTANICCSADNYVVYKYDAMLKDLL